MPVVLEDCKAASLEITKEYIKDVNIEMRKNKKDRRTRGLVVKEKDINRKVITCLGELEYSRDLYFNKLENTYVKPIDRKSTRLNSSHANISYAVFCLKKKK